MTDPHRRGERDAVLGGDRTLRALPARRHSASVQANAGQDGAMTKSRILIMSTALVLVGVACDSDGSETPGQAGDGAPECPTEGDGFEDTKLYIEHNASDEDTGVHALIAAEGWREFCVPDPNGNRLVVAR